MEGIMQSSWDPRTYVIHIGPLVGKSASLAEIFVACAGATYTPQHPPPGWMYFGTHVDDVPSLHTRCHDGKIYAYFCGQIQVVYALKFVGWQRILGAQIVIQDFADYSTVSANCIELITQTIQTHVLDKGRVLVQPRHIMAADAINTLGFGIRPDDDDPNLAEFLDMQSETRVLTGIGHWIGQWHPQAQFPCNAASKYMHNPKDTVRKFLLHMFMFLHHRPDAPVFGGPGCTSLDRCEPTVAPFTPGAKEWGHHAACDASIIVDSITGGNQLLAGARIDTVCQRQHLKSPDPHGSEIVAAGTFLHRVLPVRGQLLELSILQDTPTPLYIDSASAIFVINDKSAVKRSVWLLRRAAILQEAVEMGEIVAIKIGEADNFADPETKAMLIKVWERHLSYVNNITPRDQSTHVVTFTAAASPTNWAQCECPIARAHGVRCVRRGLSRFGGLCGQCIEYCPEPTYPTETCRCHCVACAND